MAILKGKKDEITVHVKAELEMDLRKKQIVPFKATFMVLPPKESKALVKRFTDEDDNFGEEDLVRETLIGWSDLEGADGATVEFDADVLEEVLSVREYLAALVRGFMEAQFGRQAVAAKN